MDRDDIRSQFIEIASKIETHGTSLLLIILDDEGNESMIAIQKDAAIGMLGAMEVAKSSVIQRMNEDIDIKVDSESIHTEGMKYN